MIVEALVRMMTGLVKVIFGLLGTLSAPAWVGNLAGNMSTLVAQGADMAIWVPWTLIGSVVAALLVCAGISLVVRVVRVVISLFTGGGGSGA